MDFWRASAAAPAWFEGPSIVILERAYKITMTFDVRGAAAGADHGGTGLRTRPRSARRAGWTRDAPTPATVYPMRRESLELRRADTAPSSAARCRMASSDIAVMLLLFSSRPWRPGSSIGRTPSSLPRWREWCIFVAVRGHGEHLAQPQIRGLVITAPGAYAASSSVEIRCDT